MDFITNFLLFILCTSLVAKIRKLNSLEHYHWIIIWGLLFIISWNLNTLVVLIFMYIIGFLWLLLSLSSILIKHSMWDKNMWLNVFKYSLWSWVGIDSLLEDCLKLSNKVGDNYEK